MSAFYPRVALRACSSHVSRAVGRRLPPCLRDACCVLLHPFPPPITPSTDASPYLNSSANWVLLNPMCQLLFT